MAQHKTFGGKIVSPPLIQIAADPDTGIPSYQLWCRDKLHMNTDLKGTYHWFSFAYRMNKMPAQAKTEALELLDMKGISN